MYDYYKRVSGANLRNSVVERKKEKKILHNATINTEEKHVEYSLKSVHKKIALLFEVNLLKIYLKNVS